MMLRRLLAPVSLALLPVLLSAQGLDTKTLTLFQ